MPRRAFDLLLLAASLLLATTVGEAALRLAGWSWPVFYRPDPVLGEVPIPRAEGWDRSENPIFVRFNSHGMRDRERTLEKPPHTFRIAFLGDSYIEAKQVELEDTVAAVLERRLANCPNLRAREVEVLNFGVSGYGTTQQLLMFEERARRFAPDLVILGFFSGNDVRNNSLELQGPSKPHFVERDGELVLDRSFLDGFGSALRASPVGRFWYELAPDVRVVQLVSAAARARRERELEARRAEEERTAAVRVGEPGFEPGLDHQIFLEPPPPPWERAWAITERILARLARRVREAGAAFLLVSLSNGIQVHPDPRVRARFAERLGVEDLWAPERRLEAIATRHGIDHLALAPLLLAHAETTGRCLHGFVGAVACGGHWNAEGHRVAGEILADHLCRRWDREGGAAALAGAPPGP